MSTLSMLIQEAWTARMSGKIPEVRELLQRIQDHEAGGHPRASDLSEIILLKASLSRSALELDEAWQMIREAKTVLTTAGIEGSFQLSFQSGLCYDAGSRFADSLKCYQEAFVRARDEGERLLAKYNQAISLHNLGLPVQRVIQEIDELLEKQPDSRFRSGLEQIRLMELKRCFNEVDFVGLARLDFKNLSQGLYLQALMQSLPWCRASGTEKRELFIEKAISSEELFQKDYRLKTLTADPRFGIGSESTLQMRVDRIYLWTWLWIENPASGITALLGEELESIPFESAFLSTTAEDTFLLRSALAWLAPFNSKFAAFAEAWDRKGANSSNAPSRFEKMDRAIREAWLNESLDASRSLLLAEFPDCAGLLDFLKRIPSPLAHAEVVDGTLLVKEKDFLLVDTRERVISEPLVRLIVLLNANESISFEEILAASFGIRGYDSLDHGPKIHALVQRLKKLLPEGVLAKTKNERVYLENKSDRIVIEKSTLHERNFPMFELDATILGKKQTMDRQTQIEVSDRAVLISLFEKSTTRTRDEIQSALGLSKATTNRHLVEWVRQGLLKRTGQGPRSRYQLI